MAELAVITISIKSESVKNGNDGQIPKIMITKNLNENDENWYEIIQNGENKKQKFGNKNVVNANYDENNLSFILSVKISSLEISEFISKLSFQPPSNCNGKYVITVSSSLSREFDEIRVNVIAVNDLPMFYIKGESVSGESSLV